MRQFEKESMATKIIFALMARKVDEFKKRDKEYPIEVRNILDDLWIVELSNQLPPIRDIQLTISLLIIHNYFVNYQFVSQHWKVFQNLVVVLHEIEEVLEILRFYLNVV